MKIKENKKRGFTLVEIIMVIVILGILAVVAVPIYSDLTGRANESAEAGVVGGVRSGILTFYANQNPPAYPATLDGLGNNTACSSTTACFATILGQGAVTDNTWTKNTATQYTHVATGAGGNTSVYVYTPATGNFVCSTILGACP